MNSPGTNDQSFSDFSTAIGPVLENFNDLDENGQNQLLIGAFASKDIALIQQISKLKKNANELALLPRLVKNLVADAKKLEITNLKYHQDPGKRRYFFNVWLQKIKDVLQMNKQTQGIIIGTKIVLSDKPASASNQAVYHFVASKVDNYYRTKISQESHGLGAESLLLLQKFCAHVSPQDKIHFHQKFLELRILPNETATSFLRRFTIARDNAERVDCTYTDSELDNSLQIKTWTPRKLFVLWYWTATSSYWWSQLTRDLQKSSPVQAECLRRSCQRQ